MKGKTVILFFVVSLFTARVFAQQKVDVYCGVSARMMGVFSSYWYVDFGKDSSRYRFKDATIKKQLLEKSKAANPVDEINYMSSLGWQFVAQGKSGISDIYYFKRTFDTSEFINPVKVTVPAN